jgi:hypothetical protein
MFKGVVNVVGDNVTITKDNDPQGTPWKAKIKQFIYHLIDDEINVYFVADYISTCKNGIEHYFRKGVL